MTATPGLFVVGLLLILIASLFVAAPLFRPARTGVSGDDASELTEWCFEVERRLADRRERRGR